jgi:hypothetical protein
MESAMEKLVQALRAAGQSPAPVEFPGGSRLLILPFGGRVVGLFAPSSAANFLWTNPALATAASARAYFGREGWPNCGGDRTWLAPEIELFIGDLAHPGQTYRVPPALDPGNWQLSDASGAPTLTATAALCLHRTGRAVRVQLSKVLFPAANPLRDACLDGLSLEYAGYGQQVTLEVCPEPAGRPAGIGLWNLLQLPQPGQMLVPTYYRATPQRVFGPVEAADVEVSPHLVRWPTAGTADRKIALKAGPLTGRAGYLSAGTVPGEWSLVVRQFEVNPSGEYVDALWEDPANRGWAFQACSVCGPTERFSELEYHVPAITAADIGSCCTDRSLVWAFRGSHDALAAVAAMLLGVEDLAASAAAGPGVAVQP